MCSVKVMKGALGYLSRHLQGHDIDKEDRTSQHSTNGPTPRYLQDNRYLYEHENGADPL